MKPESTQRVKTAARSPSWIHLVLDI